MSILFVIRYLFEDLDISIDIPNIYYLTYWILKKVPKGRVTTYGDLAEILGDVRAARSVGRLMALNRYPEKIPCYKVIHKDGRVGKYSGLGGVRRKKKLLEKEGIKIEGDRVKDLKRYLANFEGRDVFPYLESLKRLQEYLAEMVYIDRDFDLSRVRYVVSNDVAYIDGFPDIGIGASILFDCRGGCKAIKSAISLIPIYFPYIPTYLAFRELPAILSTLSTLIRESCIKPDLILVDGHGILHPRCFGIAAHLGVVMGIPTIGVAKSRLLGNTSGHSIILGEKVEKISVSEKCYGYILSRGRRKKLYISTGNIIPPEKAVEFIIKNDRLVEKNSLLLDAPHRLVSIIRNELIKDRK